MVVKPNECDPSEATLENNPPSINSDNEICPFMIDNGKSIEFEHSLKCDMIVFLEGDVQKMFTEDELIDNRTCPLYEMISGLFLRLCSLTDDIISTSPMQSPSANEK